MNRLLLILMFGVVACSWAGAEKLRLQINDEVYAVDSSGDWALSKPANESTEDCVLKSNQLATTCYLMTFGSWTESEAIINLEGERAQAKISPKESVQKVTWAKSGSAYLWHTPYYVLIYYRVESRWFRCYALFEEPERADVNALLTFLQGIRRGTL